MKLNKVFFCIIHDHRVHDKNGTATLELCSEALDEVFKGKKLIYTFGHGILVSSSDHRRDVKIIHVYFNNSTLPYKVGTEIGLHKFWLEVGKIAKKKLLKINPSRRKLFKDD